MTLITGITSLAWVLFGMFEKNGGCCLLDSINRIETVLEKKEVYLFVEVHLPV